MCIFSYLLSLETGRDELEERRNDEADMKTLKGPNWAVKINKLAFSFFLLSECQDLMDKILHADTCSTLQQQSYQSRRFSFYSTSYVSETCSSFSSSSASFSFSSTNGFVGVMVFAASSIASASMISTS